MLTFKQVRVDWTRSSGTSFTLFPKLPLELRNMIWKLSLPAARTLIYNVQHFAISRQPVGRDGPVEWRIITCSRLYTADRLQPSFPLIHICKESRTVFFENYQFLTNLRRKTALALPGGSLNELSYETAHTSCMDFKHDTMILTQEMMQRQILAGVRYALQDLELPISPSTCLKRCDTSV
jgi:hypothetical protein